MATDSLSRTDAEADLYLNERPHTASLAEVSDNGVLPAHVQTGEGHSQEHDRGVIDPKSNTAPALKDVRGIQLRLAKLDAELE